MERRDKLSPVGLHYSLEEKKRIMPKITIEEPHSLGADEAVRKLKDKFDFVRSMYGSQVQDLEESWEGHTLTFGFKAMGMKVRGTVAVEDDKATLCADLPLAAMLMKGTIENRVRQELGAILRGKRKE